ncbi:MAG TPA: DNA-processing protein DprA [Chitinispirillaceae bacterium]|jgi:DNA processing protein|nr:DNA-processing protein DprA [Chitinispirillaceae bacterium]
MPLSWIALNSIKGLGPVRIKLLLDKFGSPDNIFKESVQNLRLLIPESCIIQINKSEIFTYAEKQLYLANKSGFNILTISDKNYPFYLKQIFAPPVILYTKGKISVFSNHAVSVVGTRNPTQYGKYVTKQICKDLLGQNLIIVSGLARGIDTIAHETCVQNNRATIAVLGSGIDKIYPQSNLGLAEKITEKGMILSEFPLGIPPEAFNFPRRNRIISGLSAGVVVVEAGKKSGSLITAHYALQQGREVFSVPGPITSPLSVGTFNLLRDGAIPARSGLEIAENLKFVSNTSNLSTCCLRLPKDLLNDQEKLVLQQLSDMPNRIDEISEKTNILISDLFSILLNLELKGFIKQISGQQYISLTSEYQ